MHFVQSRYFKLLDYFRISNAFSRNVALLFFSNTLNNLAMFIANVAVARNYSHEEFGLFSVAATIALTTFSISEFGMNLTMVRLYKLHIEDKEKAAAILACNLYFKIVVAGLLIGVSLVLGHSLSQLFAKTADHSLMLGIALTTGGILGFWSYAKGFFQIHEQFQQIATLTIGYALLRLLIIGGILSLPSTLAPELLFGIVYLGPLLIVLIYGYSIIGRALNITALKARELFSALQESLSYSKWVAASGISFVLIQQSTIFMTATLGDLKQVALLNAALLFTSVFSLLNDSWQQVAFPKIAGLTKDTIASYRARVFHILPWFFLFSILVIASLSVAMSFVLGPQYGDSIPLFWITSLGTATTIAFGFFSILMHSINRPQVSFYVNLFTLAMVISVGGPLMMKMGLLGLIGWYAFSIATGELVKSLLINRLAQTI